MSTSDPIFYPIRRGSPESLRQDIVRTRTDLVGTLEELSGRINIADRARAGLRTGAVKAGPVVGAGVATSTAIALVRRRQRARSANASGRDPLVATDDAEFDDPPRRRSGVGIATLGVLVASVAAYAIRRRARHARTTVAANGNPGRSTESTEAEAMDTPDRLTNTQVPQRTDDMRDIGDVLTEQHRHLDQLFARVESADRPVTKRETFASLVDFMNRHERAEQEIVHPMLRDIGPDGVDMWTRRMNEEEVADRALASLIAQDVEHPNFTSGIAKLRSMVRAHAQHEEDEEFPLLRANVPGSTLRRVATRVRVAQIDYW